MKCVCGCDLTSNAKFCRSCGKPVSQLSVSEHPAATAAAAPAPAIVCGNPACRAAVPAGKRFCNQCGTPVGATAPRPVPQEIAAPPAMPLHTAQPTVRIDPPISQRPRPSQPSKIRPWHIIVVAVLAIAGFIGYRMYQAGIMVTFKSIPPASTVMLDNVVMGPTSPDGVLAIRTERGSHQLQVTHPGYEDFHQTMEIGMFATKANIDVTLVPKSYRLTLQTIPPQSTVSIDGVKVGMSDGVGFLVTKATDGSHTVSVEAAGFPTVAVPFEIHNDSNLMIDLQAKAAEIQRQKSQDLAQANMLFGQGQYDAAIATCDAVLKTLPDDKDVLALKQRIQQAKSILGR